jgi:hypothetical protein
MIFALKYYKFILYFYFYSSNQTCLVFSIIILYILKHWSNITKFLVIPRRDPNIYELVVIYTMHDVRKFINFV